MTSQPSDDGGGVERLELRDLPRRGWQRLSRLVGRALTRRCPECGSGGIFSSWWALRDCCPRCGVTFVREEGYFLGAYAINLIIAEFGVVALAIYLLFRTDLSLLWLEVIAGSLAILSPIFFYPYSQTLWMALDLMLDPRGRGPDQKSTYPTAPGQGTR